MSDQTPRTIVPANLDTPDCIAFGLTFRQLAIISGVAGAGWFAYSSLGPLVPAIVWLIAAIPVAGITVVIALGRRDGLSLDVWLRHGITMRRTPRIQVPGQTATGQPLVTMVAAPAVPAPLRPAATTITGEGVVTVDGTDRCLVACGTTNISLRTGTEQAAVWEDAGLVGLSPGRRYLCVGVPLLESFTVSQMRAVLAHELGHYARGHTRLGAVTYRGMVGIAGTIGRLGPRNPVGLAMLAYGAAYAAVSMAVRRRMEAEADRTAAQAAGREAIVSALRDLPALAIAWEAYLDSYLGLAPGRRVRTGGGPQPVPGGGAPPRPATGAHTGLAEGAGPHPVGLAPAGRGPYRVAGSGPWGSGPDGPAAGHPSRRRRRTRRGATHRRFRRTHRDDRPDACPPRGQAALLPGRSAGRGTQSHVGYRPGSTGHGQGWQPARARAGRLAGREPVGRRERHPGHVG